MHLSTRLTSTSTTPETNLHLERVERNWDKLSTTGTVPVELRETEQFASLKIEPIRNI
jgi:hypothetical protein